MGTPKHVPLILGNSHVMSTRGGPISSGHLHGSLRRRSPHVTYATRLLQEMIASLDKGSPIWTPKYCHPDPWDAPKGTPNFGKPPNLFPSSSSSPKVRCLVRAEGLKGAQHPSPKITSGQRRQGRPCQELWWKWCPFAEAGLLGCPSTFGGGGGSWTWYA